MGRVMRAYVTALSLPGAAQFVTAGLIARAPVGMRVVGTILFVSAITESFAIAGAVTASLTIATAAAAPAIGRLASRYPQASIFFWTLPTHVLAMVALILLVVWEAPAWTYYAAAVIAGLSTVPVGSFVRTRWSRATVGTTFRPTAYALEGVLDEIIFITGPIAVTALAIGVHPAAGLMGALVLYIVGSIVLSALRRTEPRDAATGRVTIRTRSVTPGVAVLMGIYFLTGLYFGTLDVGIIAFAEEQQSPLSTGVLLGLLAAGSALTGLVYGSRTWPGTLQLHLVASMIMVALGSLLLPNAESVSAMALFIFIAGLGLGPVLIAGASLAGDLVANDSLTETLAWLSSAITLGMAAGAGAGGVLVDQFDGAMALASGAASAALALLATAIGYRSLNPRRDLVSTGPVGQATITPNWRDRGP